jgi:superfamily I DNA/RNA helicase
VPFATRGLESRDISPGQFDQVLIDEYQDLTACEQALVELIWSRTGSLVVFGDDDQSIYGFRFNHPGGITEFPSRWNESEFEDIPIPDNHRSGANIVGAANTMMAESGASKPPMVSRYLQAGEVTRVHWPSLDEEIVGLATYINAKPEQRFLVLVPLKLIGYRLKDAVGPDAQTSFSESLLEHRIVQERFTLASLVANPNDRIALRAWFSLRGDTSEPHARRNCVAYASALRSDQSGLPLVQAICDERITITGEGKSHITARARELLGYLTNMPEDVSAKLEVLFDPSWADGIEDQEQRKWATRDLEMLRNAALRLVVGEGPKNDLADVIHRLRYQIATRAPLEQSDTPRIHITTLHSAKGLQADSVMIVGLADQILPGKVADNLEDREERRRLLYVCITRPRNELIVSWPRQMRYEDAIQNNVRIDPRSVRTINGVKQVTLSKSSLLSSDFPGPLKSGESWLRGHSS